MQALRRMDDEVVKAKRLKQERDAQDDDAANLHVSRRCNGGVRHCASITASSLFVH